MSTYLLPRYPNPAHLSANGTPSGTTVLTGEGWEEVDTLTGLGGGLTDTITFYAASSSGGSVSILNTVTIVSGIITSWTQGSGTPGEWQFDDSVNSGQAMLMWD